MKKTLIAVKIFFYLCILGIISYFLYEIRLELKGLKTQTKQIETQFKEYKDNTALSQSKYATKEDLKKSISFLSKEIKKEIKKEKIVYVTEGDVNNSYENVGITDNLHYQDNKLTVDIIRKSNNSYLWNYKIKQNFHFDIIGTQTKDAYKVRVKVTDKDTGKVLKIENLQTKYNFDTKPTVDFFIGGTTAPSILGGVRYKNYSIFYQLDLKNNESSFGVLRHFTLRR